jgi:hypothetical protein
MRDDADHGIRFGRHPHAFGRGRTAERGKCLHGDRQALQTQYRIPDLVAVAVQVDGRRGDEDAENRARRHSLECNPAPGESEIRQASPCLRAGVPSMAVVYFSAEINLGPGTKGPHR